MMAHICKTAAAVCKSSSRFCKTRTKSAARILGNHYTEVDRANTRYCDKGFSRGVYPQTRRLLIRATGRIGGVLQAATGNADRVLQELDGGSLQEHSIPVRVKGGGR